jgi:S1-C subfamily serine protease
VPVLDLDDAPAGQPRPPRRTWRELPPSPPVSDLLPPPDPRARATGTVDEEAGTAAEPATPAPDRHRGLKVGVGIVVVAALVAGGAYWMSRDGDGATTPTVASGERNGPAAVAAALGPAVVQIDRADGGLGSGVIIDTDGLVLTAHHVVTGVDDVTVRTADDQQLSGRVVGRVPERDLAVIAVDGGEDLTAARIAEPGTVEVGEEVVALGSPFGFTQSVTSGIVSGLDRELDTPVGTLTGLIQTDTSINPGNSGGPLADADGIVIGINTAIASASGGSDGVGFAIPVEDYADLLEQVRSDGGSEAATVPAPDEPGGSGLPFEIPGLGDLELPSLDDLSGLLDDLLNGLLDGTLGEDGLGGAANDAIDSLLEDLFPGVFGEDGTDDGTNDGTDEGSDGSTDEGGIQGDPALGLIEPGSLPEDYEIARSSVGTSEADGTTTGRQVVVLEGGEGTVTIVAERGERADEDFAALDGDELDLGEGREGIRLDDAVAVLDGDTLVIVRGTPDVPMAELVEIAEALEVRS